MKNITFFFVLIIFMGLLGNSLGEIKKKYDTSDSKGTNRKRKLQRSYIKVQYKEVAQYPDGFYLELESRLDVLIEVFSTDSSSIY